MSPRLFISNMISADGYFEGPGRDLSWNRVDAEFNDYAVSLLESVDRLLFGRITWELMASYWPTEAAQKNDPEVAALMNRVPKYVCSHSPQKLTWQNSQQVAAPCIDNIRSWKSGQGGDIAVFGSGQLCRSLLEARLVDELRLIVAPVLLGKGKSLFEGMSQSWNLTLMDLQSFASGNVLLRYRPL
jgi:dihydrofolate reductase